MFLGSKVYRYLGGRDESYYEEQGSGLYYYSAYPRVYIKSRSVNIESLEDSMIPVFMALDQIATGMGLRGFIITSGNDSQHMEGSYHYKGRAVDISIFEAITYPRKKIEGIGEGGDVFNMIFYSINPIGEKQKFDVVWEVNHIHIEYDPSDTIVAANPDPKDSKPKPNPGSTPDVKPKELIPYVYCTNYGDDVTLEQLVDRKNSLLSGYEELGYTKEQWIEYLTNFDPGLGITNREWVEDYYPEIDGEPQYEWPTIPFGCSIMIPSYSALRDILRIKASNQDLPLYNIPFYRDAYDDALASNKYYKRMQEIDVQSKDGYSTEYTVENIDANLSVWIFCKADNQIHDVTRICTSVNFNSGVSDNFSVTLAFSRDEDEESSSNDDSYVQSLQNTVIRTDINANRLSDIAKNVSENDIVWIRFENLDIEFDPENKGDKQRSGYESGIVSFSELAGNFYDFMGLVSEVNQLRDFENGDGAVMISGGSFQKMFMEDETVFMPIAAVSGEAGGNLVFNGPSDAPFQRMFVSGQYEFLFAHSFRSIENTMKFYMNILANSGMVPDKNDNLFSSYSNSKDPLKNDDRLVDRRTYLHNIDYKGDFSDVEARKVLAKGIYQIIKLSVDPALANRFLTDSSVANPSGSLMSLFQNICVWPLAEILMDTYMDVFAIVCRIPPFTQSQIMKFVHSKARENDNNQREVAESEGYSGDVEGAIDARMNSFAGGQITASVVTASTPDYIITIDESFVETESLVWETDFYTWYQIEMKGSWLGGNDATILNYMPILYLSEYVERWGSRRMSIVSPYSVASQKVGDNYDRLQAVSDLVYAVESTMYLPFTRRGTISLNMGDRRIKKGSWILYAPTNELFYVDSVSQSYSIDEGSITRNTTIQVSRGMVRSYIDHPTYSYFNLIDLQALRKMLDDFAKKPRLNIKTTLQVNKDVFDFFMSKKQFE